MPAEVPAERMDWRHEPTSQFQVHPLSEHRPRPHLISACALLESLPHCFRSFIKLPFGNREFVRFLYLATALPHSLGLCRSMNLP
jgi:hypothetical protein